MTPGREEQPHQVRQVVPLGVRGPRRAPGPVKPSPLIPAVAAVPALRTPRDGRSENMDGMRARDGERRSARLRAAAGADLTYPEVGASTGPLPAGYRHVRRSHDIGIGRAAFDGAVDQLLTWNLHRGAGLGVEATAPRATVGSAVVLRLGIGPVGFFAPCRVVVVLDDPRCKGFAYGTLPGHPEVGEELFAVTWDDDDRVRMRIRAFSRPSTLWVRLGDPVSRRVQDRITDRYVAAVVHRR